MVEHSHYKRIIVILLVVITVLSVVVYAAKRIQLGHCVQDCAHVYNPTFADYKNNTQFPIQGFVANVCVQACKADTYEGACSEFSDGCCNIFREDIDPDCEGEDYCTAHTECKSPNFFYCDLLVEDSTCKPKLVSGIACQEDYQCLDNSCDQPTPAGTAC
ncbi:hypothetical protein GOV04_04200 [Candidatus Woesearchaeota archaeon]|nr:hypothetical protein [Candidatus Woesearchaeota archaeon]